MSTALLKQCRSIFAGGFLALICGAVLSSGCRYPSAEVTQLILAPARSHATSVRVLTSAARPDAGTIRLKVTLQNRGRTTLQWNQSPFSLFRASLVSEDRQTASSFGNDRQEVNRHQFDHFTLIELKPGEIFVWEPQLAIVEPLQTSTVLVTIVANFQIVGISMPVEFPCATLKLPVPAAK
jgi:hypothetical protein